MTRGQSLRLLAQLTAISSNSGLCRLRPSITSPTQVSGPLSSNSLASRSRVVGVTSESGLTSVDPPVSSYNVIKCGRKLGTELWIRQVYVRWRRGADWRLPASTEADVVSVLGTLSSLEVMHPWWT